MDRRRFFAAGGTVGLGALVAACSSEPATTEAVVPTKEGGAAGVSPQTPLSGELFPDTASCTLTPAETEGPYYFDVNSIRTDIREDRPGTAFRLALRVRDAACAPIGNAVVDIWHCDAGGSYSGFESGSRGGGKSDTKTYLRGAQVTNTDGIVEFRTIYPGWYPGRAVHIHFKVHVGNSTVLTSQLYFDETVTDSVYAAAPYSKPGSRTPNSTDSLFEDPLLLDLRQTPDGYLGSMTINVKAS
jgi:protocatechuate 3,4-dioxygenase beta subunit